MAVFNRNIEKANFYTPMGKTRGGDYQWGGLRFHWGLMGIGKTAIAEQLAYWLGAEGFHPLVASQLSPGDCAVPFLNEDGEAFGMRPPEWVIELDKLKSAVLFLDEMGDGSKAVQSMFQSIVNERRVGNYVLGGHIRIIAAGNPVGVSTQGIPLSAPFANRGGHVDIKFGREEAMSFIDHLLGGGDFVHRSERIDYDAETARVLAAWDREHGKWNALGAGYIKATLDENISRVLDLPKPGDPRRSRAFASPRSVARALCAATGAVIHDLSDGETESYVGSMVGESWASEFFDYVADAELVDPDDVLAGRAEFKYDPARPDRAMVTLDACASRLVTYQREKLDPKVLKGMTKRFWTVIRPVAIDDIDTPATAVKVLCNAGLSRGHKEARDVLSRMWPMLEAAGFAKESL